MIARPARKGLAKMAPRVNLWLEIDGQVALSSWRVALLEAVDRLGSISAAAAAMHVPYRRAWQKLREMERRLGVPLLETSVGGQHGGGAHLTAAGRRCVEQFHEFGRGLEADVVARFRSVFEAGR
jgi:molybdate transport system regulatory protein